MDSLWREKMVGCHSACMRRHVGVCGRCIWTWCDLCSSVAADHLWGWQSGTLTRTFGDCPHVVRLLFLISTYRCRTCITCASCALHRRATVLYNIFVCLFHIGFYLLNMVWMSSNNCWNPVIPVKSLPPYTLQPVDIFLVVFRRTNSKCWVYKWSETCFGWDHFILYLFIKNKLTIEGTESI